MALIKTIGLAILGLAITIGSIGKFAPHHFMSLPFPLSIIFYVSTGNVMPPYFMNDPWDVDEIDTWTKDGDLVVATGTKSGTTWMLYCTHQIRTKATDTNDELFPDVGITTPWPDLRQSRAGTWAEQKGRYNTTILPDGKPMSYYWDHPSYPFRIFKSHYSPAVLPVRKTGGKKIKYLAMVRNGIDMAASFTPFYASHTNAFRKLWGGFPPVIPEDTYAGDEPPAAVKDLLPGSPLEIMYFGYVRNWWPYRDDPNVILLHYSNVRKDLKGHVSKIANFLDVDLTEEELDTVTERCGMDHMKKRPERYKYLTPLNIDGKRLWDVETDHLMAVNSMIKTGQVGKGKWAQSHPVVV